VGSDVPCDEVDKQLFRISTVVRLGNGNKARFWESAWLDGCAPRDLALRLFKLAWRKNQSVSEYLSNDNWMRGLWRMTEADEMVELINLWSLIQNVQLLPREVLTVDYRIKVHMDLQADKSTVVVKGPFFPRVVNPRYRICGTMCNTRIQSSKARKAIL
jgi:hypothetical protein